MLRIDPEGKAFVLLDSPFQEIRALHFDDKGMPVVDRLTMQSTRPDVFFGGDAAWGPENIIWAVEHGHQAAISINNHCQGVPLTEVGFGENGRVDVNALDAAITAETACVLIQSPNFFGTIEDVAAIAEIAHKKGALLIVSIAEAVSLGIVKQPAEADIVSLEAQSFGVAPSYGGPFCGVIACKEKFLRQMPGRIVGETKDMDGKRGFVLTLSTREQHIRREKATSNICTNQGLLALRASIYLAAMGPSGLRQAAELSARKAHYAAAQLTKVPGVKLAFDRPFFKEFTLRVPGDVTTLLAGLAEDGYLAGLPLGRYDAALADCVSVAVTEKRTKAEIDGLAAALRRRLTAGARS